MKTQKRSKWDSITKCLICQGDSFFLKKANEYDLFKCRNCGLEFVSPMPTKECLDDFYKGYHDIRASDAVTRRNAVRNFNFLKQCFHIDSKTKILDFGCGNNKFVEVCRENEIENSFGYDGYVNDREDEKKISLELAVQNKWDIICLWGVLEHLVSPSDEMMHMKTMLSKNGLIAITTIYIDGKIPFQYKPPEHTLYFTKKSLYELAVSIEMSISSFEDYVMEQFSDIYLSVILRTVPDRYKKLIYHKLPEFVEIPTNEVRLVLANR